MWNVSAWNTLKMLWVWNVGFETFGSQTLWSKTFGSETLWISNAFTETISPNSLRSLVRDGSLWEMASLSHCKTLIYLCWRMSSFKSVFSFAAASDWRASHFGKCTKVFRTKSHAGQFAGTSGKRDEEKNDARWVGLQQASRRLVVPLAFPRPAQDPTIHCVVLSRSSKVIFYDPKQAQWKPRAETSKEELVEKFLWRNFRKSYSFCSLLFRSLTLLS